ncbi:MAG: hypothetical protein JSR47_09635 [Proteobacteria bacterium]|nr:hypothetical protein [Pseudomonadota bacterium]
MFGGQLDRSKGSGRPHDAERDPGHFIALDDNGLVAGMLRTKGFAQSKRFRVDYQSTFVRAPALTVKRSSAIPPHRACACAVWDRARTLILETRNGIRVP